MKRLDSLLNKITMYRLLLYGLASLVVVAIAGNITGLLQFNTFALMGSAAIFLIACYLSNRFFAKLYGASTNYESSLITALILFFMFSPPASWLDAVVLVVISSLSMASKYLLAFREKHIFNPAAIAAVLISLFGVSSASWWIANKFMLIFVVLLGLLITRKMRRFPMVLIFIAATLLITFIKNYSSGGDSLMLFRELVFSWPLIFIGTIMLTEPLTMPSRKRWQLVYGALVATIFSSGLQLGPLYSTPEMALVAGNIFSYTTLLRQRLRLRLLRGEELGGGVYEFTFEAVRPFRYYAGQYVELTMPHLKTDARGNRRFFTMATSPTEPTVRFGMRLDKPSSSFKTALANLRIGDYVFSSQLAGDFILPKNPNTKLLFIAGGVGVTPFRSMLKYLADTQQQRDIVLLYQVSAVDRLVYKDVLQAAVQYGVRTVYVLSTGPENVPADWQGETGRINNEMLSRQVSDLRERICYISGPDSMVTGLKGALKKSGVKRRHIKTDYFTGY
jgi:ferredoxin-NADP reductase